MMIEHNGTNPILDALGDEPNVRDITLTNQSHHRLIEPLTGVHLPPYDEVMIRVTGDVAFETISHNIEQLNLIYGRGAIAIDSEVVDDTPEPEPEPD